MLENTLDRKHSYKYEPVMGIVVILSSNQSA